MNFICQKIGDQIWVHCAGETFAFPLPGKTRNGKTNKATSADPTQILAPMPGKVMKVHVKIGDSVSRGQTLISQEAMKMEYHLKAQANGRVLKLTCQTGDQVELSQLLVVLEINADKGQA